MKFGRSALEKKIEQIQGPELRQKNRFMLFLCSLAFTLIIGFFVIGASFAAGSFYQIIKNSPKIEDLNAIRPTSAKSIVYAADGSIMQELIQSGSNRISVEYEDLPENLINAFVAIEDSRFFTHDGVDVKGIFRALFVGIRSGTLSEGASTLTQQLIKNNIFNGGLEKNYGDRIERKFQEQYLALRAERELSKETILRYYLNTINLGSNCLGVQVAAQRYFGKNVRDLNLEECTVLAAITSNPTRYNPITHPENNQKRRLIVLGKMLEAGKINEAEYNDASSEEVYRRIQTIADQSGSESHAFSYFTDAVFEDVLQELQEQLDYTDTQAYNLMYSGGLRIYTTMDPRIQKIVDEEANDPSNYSIRLADGKTQEFLEYALTYRLTVSLKGGAEYYYDETNLQSYFRETAGKKRFKLTFQTEEALNEAVKEFRDYITGITGGTVVSESVTATIEPQLSVVVMDQATGEVKALLGGRGDKDAIGSLVLNRATMSTRQPGSTFKILTAYAPALDVSGATLATTIYDEPLSYFDKSIRNWWGDDHLGYVNIRYAIMASMNIPAVKCLEEIVGENVGFAYARNFGITTLLESDKSPVMTLGGLTYGVTNLELTAAYAAIANGGIYTRPILWTRVTDASGNVLMENVPETRTAVKPVTAQLLTSALEEAIYPSYVLFPDYGVTATSSDCRLDGMQAAGKSGTTTDANDLWFVGYTPLLTTGVWSGYDSSKSFGESPGYHKRIWQKIMSRIHEGEAPQSFDYSGLETALICSKSGLLARDGVCTDCGDPNSHVYTEYFAPGTAPAEYCDRHVRVNICTESGQLAGEYCPEESVETRIYLMILPEHADSLTDDSRFAIPEGLLGSSCTLHGEIPDESETETTPEETESSDEPETETSTSETPEETSSEEPVSEPASDPSDLETEEPDTESGDTEDTGQGSGTDNPSGDAENPAPVPGEESENPEEPQPENPPD